MTRRTSAPSRLYCSRLCLTALIVLAVPLGGAAQQPAPPAAGTGADPAQAEPPKGTLADQYIDGSFGFALKPPAGTIIQRQKKPVGNSDYELAQFVHLTYTWSLSVRLSATTRPLDARMITDGITESLRREFQDVNVIRAEPATIAARDGARYAATFITDGQVWYRQQAVIQAQPTEYFALVFLTPERDRQIATATFDKIVESFQILRNQAKHQRLQEALERGRKLIDAVAAGKPSLASVKVNPEHYLLFVLDGREIGFVQIREAITSLSGQSGIQVNEWAWLFREDNGVTHLRNAMFLSDNLAYEKWENRLYELAPPQAGRVGRVATLDVDSGLRRDDQLLIAYTVKPGDSKLQDKLIDVDDSYASAAWHVVLPRLIDMKQSELYAFSSYHRDRRGLILRVFQIMGPEPLRLGERSVTAYKIEDSEGWLPPVSEIWLDATGRILKLTSGKLEMVEATREYVERKYKLRVEEAEALFKEAKIPEPIPASRDDPASKALPPARGFGR